MYTSCLLFRVAFWGVHKCTPVKYKHMIFPPACSSPHIIKDLLGSWPGRYMRMDSGHPLTTQSVRFHSLSGTISVRLQECYGLLPARPGYMACWVESLCVLASGVDTLYTEPEFLTFMEPRNRFQGTNSASLCGLAGRYDNPIPTRFLAPIDFLKIPALYSSSHFVPSSLK
jgi:hypothetical protein